MTLRITDNINYDSTEFIVLPFYVQNLSFLGMKVKKVISSVNKPSQVT